jgi:hypothetical protein
MSGFRRLPPLLACFLILALPMKATAASLEVPPAHTGGFGEPDCTACHFDRSAKSGMKHLVIDGLPDAYEGGKTYQLTIRLSDVDMRIAGFLLSARAAGTEPCGATAGLLEPLDARTAKITYGQPPVEYLRSIGSEVEQLSVPTATWKLSWRAPEDAERYVAFHLAANAGNGDDSPFGDNVYRLEIILHPARNP